MIGEADKGTARWEISVFRNRFVKEDGVWKLKELNVYPILDVDYFKGWASEGVVRNVSLPPMLGVTVDKRVASGTQSRLDRHRVTRRSAPASRALDGLRRHRERLRPRTATTSMTSSGRAWARFSPSTAASNRRSPVTTSAASAFPKRPSRCTAERRPRRARESHSIGARSRSSMSRRTGDPQICAPACSIPIRASNPRRSAGAAAPRSCPACIRTIRPCWKTASGGCGAWRSTSPTSRWRAGKRAGPA